MAEHPMADLRRKLHAAGLLAKPAGKSWTKVIFLFIIVGALIFGHTQLTLIQGLIILPITALFATTLAMTAHEGVHSSACNSKWGNLSLAGLAFPLFSGMSMEYWRVKHNIKHHANPNVIDKDPDIYAWPITFTQEEYESSGPIRKIFQRYVQAWIFWPISLLVGHLLRWDGIWYLISHPFVSKKNHRFSKIWLADSGLVLVHFYLWLVLPVQLGMPWQTVVGFYVLLWALVGTLLTGIFIVGHAGRPIVVEYDKNWRLQIETARRIKFGPIGSFFFVGLDYQIEHHLLPALSHFNLPKAAPMVKQYAEERGWEYEEVGFISALWSSTVALKNAWKTPSIVIDTTIEANANLVEDLSH